MSKYHRRTLRPDEAQARLRRLEELFPRLSRTSGSRTIAHNRAAGGSVASKHLRREDRRDDDGNPVQLDPCPFNPEGVAEAQDFVDDRGLSVPAGEQARMVEYAAILGFWAMFKPETGCLHLQWRRTWEN